MAINTFERQNGAPIRPAVATAAVPSLLESERASLSEDLAGNTRVTLAGAPASATYAADPVSGLSTPTLTDLYTLTELMLREMRISNLLLMRLSEPYATANPSLILTDPEQGIGVQN
jgi:hypothetical protein